MAAKGSIWLPDKADSQSAPRRRLRHTSLWAWEKTFPAKQQADDQGSSIKLSLLPLVQLVPKSS
jgi:hypothetical protein